MIFFITMLLSLATFFFAYAKTKSQMENSTSTTKLSAPFSNTAKAAQAAYFPPHPIYFTTVHQVARITVPHVSVSHVVTNLYQWFCYGSLCRSRKVSFFNFCQENKSLSWYTARDECGAPTDNHCTPKLIRTKESATFFNDTFVRNCCDQSFCEPTQQLL